MPVSETVSRHSSGLVGVRGIQPWTVRTPYTAYTSPYGPKYKAVPHYHGISLGRATRFGITLAGFGGVAGFFALFFFAEVPKVRDDIMKKVPIIGEYFNTEVAPEDNPF